MKAAGLHPREMRERIRKGEWTGATVGCSDGYVQANLVVLPQRLAGDFLLFCERNPGPCPLLEATRPGEYEPVDTAPGADLRTDLPRYRIYEDGSLRADFTPEDMPLVFMTGGRVLEAAREVAPDLWRRYVGLLLDGLRAEGATPLPRPALTRSQMNRLLDRAQR